MPDGVPGRIHRVRRVAGRDHSTRGGPGVCHRSGVVQMMGNISDVGGGARIDPLHGSGDASMQALAFELWQRRDERLADQLVRESPSPFVPP